MNDRKSERYGARAQETGNYVPSTPVVEMAAVLASTLEDEYRRMVQVFPEVANALKIVREATAGAGRAQSAGGTGVAELHARILAGLEGLMTQAAASLRKIDADVGQNEEQRDLRAVLLEYLIQLPDRFKLLGATMVAQVDCGSSGEALPRVDALAPIFRSGLESAASIQSARFEKDLLLFRAFASTEEIGDGEKADLPALIKDCLTCCRYLDRSQVPGLGAEIAAELENAISYSWHTFEQIQKILHDKDVEESRFTGINLIAMPDCVNDLVGRFVAASRVQQVLELLEGSKAAKAPDQLGSSGPNPGEPRDEKGGEIGEPSDVFEEAQPAMTPEQIAGRIQSPNAQANLDQSRLFKLLELLRNAALPKLYTVINPRTLLNQQGDTVPLDTGSRMRVRMHGRSEGNSEDALFTDPTSPGSQLELLVSDKDADQLITLPLVVGRQIESVEFISANGKIDLASSKEQRVFQDEVGFTLVRVPVGCIKVRYKVGPPWELRANPGLAQPNIDRGEQEPDSEHRQGEIIPLTELLKRLVMLASPSLPDGGKGRSPSEQLDRVLLRWFPYKDPATPSLTEQGYDFLVQASDAARDKVKVVEARHGDGTTRHMFGDEPPRLLRSGTNYFIAQHRLGVRGSFAEIALYICNELRSYGVRAFLADCHILLDEGDKHELQPGRQSGTVVLYLDEQNRLDVIDPRMVVKPDRVADIADFDSLEINPNGDGTVQIDLPELLAGLSVPGAESPARPPEGSEGEDGALDEREPANSSLELPQEPLSSSRNHFNDRRRISGLRADEMCELMRTFRERFREALRSGTVEQIVGLMSEGLALYECVGKHVKRPSVLKLLVDQQMDEKERAEILSFWEQKGYVRELCKVLESQASPRAAEISSMFKEWIVLGRWWWSAYVDVLEDSEIRAEIFRRTNGPAGWKTAELIAVLKQSVTQDRPISVACVKELLRRRTDLKVNSRERHEIERELRFLVEKLTRGGSVNPAGDPHSYLLKAITVDPKGGAETVLHLLEDIMESEDFARFWAPLALKWGEMNRLNDRMPWMVRVSRGRWERTEVMADKHEHIRSALRGYFESLGGVPFREYAHTPLRHAQFLGVNTDYLVDEERAWTVLRQFCRLTDGEVSSIRSGVFGLWWIGRLSAPPDFQRVQDAFLFLSMMGYATDKDVSPSAADELVEKLRASFWISAPTALADKNGSSGAGPTPSVEGKTQRRPPGLLMHFPSLYQVVDKVFTNREQLAMFVECGIVPDSLAQKWSPEQSHRVDVIWPPRSEVLMRRVKEIFIDSLRRTDLLHQWFPSSTDESLDRVTPRLPLAMALQLVGVNRFIANEVALSLDAGWNEPTSYRGFFTVDEWRELVRSHPGLEMVAALEEVSGRPPVADWNSDVEVVKLVVGADRFEAHKRNLRDQLMRSPDLLRKAVPFRAEVQERLSALPKPELGPTLNDVRVFLTSGEIAQTIAGCRGLNEFRVLDFQLEGGGNSEVDWPKGVEEFRALCRLLVQTAARKATTLDGGAREAPGALASLLDSIVTNDYRYLGAERSDFGRLIRWACRANPSLLRELQATLRTISAGENFKRAVTQAIDRSAMAHEVKVALKYWLKRYKEQDSQAGGGDEALRALRAFLLVAASDASFGLGKFGLFLPEANVKKAEAGYPPTGLPTSPGARLGGGAQPVKDSDYFLFRRGFTPHDPRQDELAEVLGSWDFDLCAEEHISGDYSQVVSLLRPGFRTHETVKSILCAPFPRDRFQYTQTPISSYLSRRGGGTTGQSMGTDRDFFVELRENPAAEVRNIDFKASERLGVIVEKRWGAHEPESRQASIVVPLWIVKNRLEAFSLLMRSIRERVCGNNEQVGLALTFNGTVVVDLDWRDIRKMLSRRVSDKFGSRDGDLDFVLQACYVLKAVYRRNWRVVNDQKEGDEAERRAQALPISYAPWIPKGHDRGGRIELFGFDKYDILASAHLVDLWGKRGADVKAAALAKPRRR